MREFFRAFLPKLLYLPETANGNLLIGIWMDPRAGHEDMVKKKNCIIKTNKMHVFPFLDLFQ
jgi:hypothetical protein